MDGISVHTFRVRAGECLAEAHPAEADIVIAGCLAQRDGEKLLDTGTDLYFVWEDYTGGVSSSSWLFGRASGMCCP